MLVKDRMLKDVITIDVNSPMQEAINREGPIMGCPRRLGELKWISLILIISFLRGHRS